MKHLTAFLALVAVALWASFGNVGQTNAAQTVGNPGGAIFRPTQPVFFCGELGANTDEFFGGPNLVSVFTGAIPTDHIFASGNCDTLGDTAVATADNDIDEFQSYVVRGMFCQVSAAPGAAATVMTFVDDTANTDVTCDIAAAETSCASTPGAIATVAADSQVAISTLNPTDDENAQDFHCLVYISWE